MDEVTEDLVSLFVSGTDAILASTGTPPVAGLSAGFLKLIGNARKALFERKVEAFWREFQNPNVDITLVAQVFSNFREEFGAEYFNETLFNVVEKSDSVQRTKMIAQLFILCTVDEVARNEFWDILHALQVLLMKDIVYLKSAISLQNEFDLDDNSNAVEFEKKIERKLGVRIMKRYQAVGLTRSISPFGHTDVLVIEKGFAELVLRASQV